MNGSHPRTGGFGGTPPASPALVDSSGRLLNPYPGLGGTPPRTDDPAFQPPRNPLEDVGALKARARNIYREVPNVVVQQGWSIADVRSTLQDLVSGLFDRPAQLLDALASDSRVQSAMRQRSGALLGRAIRFKPADHPDEHRAKRCCRAWERHWPEMHAEPALLDLLEGSAHLGFGYAQTLWDVGGKEYRPYLQSFSARYGWYHWAYRTHVAVTMDGMYPVVGGDGTWVLHTPYGQYRGWMRGALRAVSQWWLARNYALRDWARYCERHGFPLLLADTPFGADPNDIAAYQSALGTIGQESVLQVPGSVDLAKYGKYDLRYLEPTDDGWQSFKALIEQCNDEITLALLGQNLTSQVKEGSFAAARVHADVRQAILEADARALARTLYTQVARPFAALNYGDASLAPRIEWDVRPAEDLKTKAATLQGFATAVNQFRQAGFALKEPESFARRFGLQGLSLREVPPVQIEAQLARATGKAENDTAAEPSKHDEQEADDKGEESESNDHDSESSDGGK